MTDILKVKVNNQWVGIPAIQGPNGEGVPTGGTYGQVLTKASSTDYDAVWLDGAGGGIRIGTCSTASATAEKAVTLSGFVLATGATIQVTFTNANTANVPTLNVNSTGAKAIYDEAGTAVSTTNPAYFPAGAIVEFTYNGTNWVYKKRVIQNYVNGVDGPSWYRIWSDGWIEQGGYLNNISASVQTWTFLKKFKNANYTMAFGAQSTVASALLANNVGSYSRSATSFTYYVSDGGCFRSFEAKGY